VPRAACRPHRPTSCTCPCTSQPSLHGHLLPRRRDLTAFDAFTDAAIDREAGFGAHEVRAWVAAAAAMRAAGPFDMTLSYYRIVPEWVTGMAIARGAAAA